MATIADYRAAVDEMLTLLDDLDDIETTVAKSRLMQLAYGWAAQVYSFGRAVVALVDAGLGNEADVIVKSMLEYTLTLHWLVEVGDEAVDSVRKSHQRSLRAIKTSAETGPGLTLPAAALEEALAAEIPDVDEDAALRRFQDVCRELGVEHNLYVAYRMTCGIAHPTLSAAASFVGPEDPRDEDSPLVFARRGPGRDSPIAIAAHLMIWAGRDLDRLIKHRPLRARLQSIARQIGSAAALPPRQRR